MLRGGGGSGEGLAPLLISFEQCFEPQCLRGVPLAALPRKFLLGRRAWHVRVLEARNSCTENFRSQDDPPLSDTR